VVGDKCAHFQELVDSGWIQSKVEEAASKGNSLVAYNSSIHFGSCGYHYTNEAIRTARGKYIIFYANDDLILPNHFSNYLEIEDTDWDYMYFDSYLGPLKQARVSELAPCRIGHSEIIVRTTLARKARPHQPVYGHDWDFIYDVIHKGKGKKSTRGVITYHVMHVPNYGTIDKID